MNETTMDELKEDEMIDWIKVRREARMKLIRVPRWHMEDYLLFKKLPDVSTVDLHDLPEHWMVGGVVYDFFSGSFVFQIISPEFDSVPLGACAEEIVPIRSIVKVTRELITSEEADQDQEIAGCT